MGKKMFTISVKQNDKLVYHDNATHYMTLSQTGEGIAFTSGGIATFGQSMDMLATGIANVLSDLRAQGHGMEVIGDFMKDLSEEAIQLIDKMEVQTYGKQQKN